MMPMIGQTHEHTFNLGLGEALRDTTVRWRTAPEAVMVERKGLVSNSTQRPDILVADPLAPPVIIESSFDARDARVDAINRLGIDLVEGWGTVQTAISLHIPTRFKRLSYEQISKSLRGGSSFHYALHQRPQRSVADSALSLFEWPRVGFLPGTVYDLSAFVAGSAVPQEDIESVADEVAEFVKGAAATLERSLARPHRDRIIGAVQQRTVWAGLRTTMVVWLNALLTQNHLANRYGGDFPSLMMDRRPSPLRQRENWRSLTHRNWHSIFRPAITTLTFCAEGNLHATSQALRELVRAVDVIEGARLGMHVNIGAELFPKLSEDRKQAAAFYTQAATAELLATLTILRDGIDQQDWADGQLMRNRRLVDLACGTGTLLRAGYRRIVAFHEQSGGSEESTQTLHRSAMESGLVGVDISPIAAHLTTSSLAILGSGEPYGNTQIGWVEVGTDRALTGSLEYFASDEVRDLFNRVASTSRGQAQKETPIHVPDHGMDWVLMNPPYSRTRGGQAAFDVAGLTDVEREACQARWRHLVRHEPVNNQAGMAPSFLALAKRKVKIGGRIGFVLPLTAALARSWAKTRQMVEEYFENIIVIVVAAGKALGRQALSADTGMEEMLLVGTRRLLDKKLGGNSQASQSAIHFVTLHEPPVRVGTAGEIGRAILSQVGSLQIPGRSASITVGEAEIGQVLLFDTGMKGAPWSPAGVVQPSLVAAALALCTGEITYEGYYESLGVEMLPMERLFCIGPTHHRIGHLRGKDQIGAFEFTTLSGPQDMVGPDRALWRANGNTQITLRIGPTHKGSSVADAVKVQAMRSQKSSLLYARNMRWTSQRLLAATTGRSVMGGRAWTTLRHSDPRILKAYALWANSTLGMLVHWTQGQRTHAGRSTTQIKALKRIPSPRLDKLPPDRLNQAAAQFDALAQSPLLPACQAHADDVRKAIDRAVFSLLGISEAGQCVIDTLRWLWCNEPSVHGSNKAAMRLLS